MSKEELFKEAQKYREELFNIKFNKVKPPEPVNVENGSKNRFDKVFKNHYGWWLVHNLIAHILIGILPIEPFFEFHDWTSIKMRQ
jgi:hypothetical protein